MTQPAHANHTPRKEHCELISELGCSDLARVVIVKQLKQLQRPTDQSSTLGDDEINNYTNSRALDLPHESAAEVPSSYAKLRGSA